MALANFATVVLADGPIGFWRLGEAPGSASAADASGHGNTGTYSSAGIMLGQPGFHGGDTASLFDGVTGRIVVPNSISLNPRQITMEAKISWSGPNGLQQRIFEKSSFAELAQYGLNVIDSGHVLVELRTITSGTLSIAATSTGVVTLGKETHVAATYDGKVIRIFLNGILDSETSAGGNAGDLSTKPPPSQGSDLGIGNQSVYVPPRDRPFNGLIDEVALFDKALTDKQVLAHYQSQFKERGGFQYAVKFVCGKSAGTVVAPGTYFTAINVHNPTYTEIRFRAKIAVALPGLKPGPVSKFFDARLGPDEALEIDCPDILRHAETRAEFLKGFVVIQSNVELDVIAVYTAAGRDGQVETLHTERVPPRRLELGLPD